MKLAIKKDFRKNLMKAAMLFASAITLAAFTACGKNGDSGAPPIVGPIGPGVNPYCATCPANSALLASGTGNTYYAGQLQGNITMEFYGTNVSGGVGYPQPGNTQQSNYSGSVAAQGVLTWQVPSMLCGLPAGQYSITTSQAGSWYGQSFSNVVLQATGPASVTIYANGWVSPATPALIGLDGRQYPYQVVGQFRVIPNGGYGGGYPYGGGGCTVDFINMY